MINKEQIPKNVSEALISIIWGKKWTKFVIIIIVIFTTMFALWSSLPDSIKEDWLRKEHVTTETKARKGSPKASIKNINPFWSSLSEEWKFVLLTEANISISKDTITKEDLEKIFNITQLDISNTQIKDLSPLANGKFKRLTHIFGSKYLTSIKGIGNVKNLYFLDIKNSNVESIEELFHLHKLRLLNIENTNLNKSEIDNLQKQKSNMEIKL